MREKKSKSNKNVNLKIFDIAEYQVVVHDC